MFFSFIIPVYNRPEEVGELLASFEGQTFEGDYEIVIVEDGYRLSSDAVVKTFSQLPISYYYKENSGPGDSRNYGMQRAKGDYFIILDSDCILPPQYIEAVKSSLSENPADFFGGADVAHEGFSDLQKAINYSMTSFLTTGGIRGSRRNPKGFQPRSFNMGLSKEVFLASGGFGDIHPGEDPDLTLRLWKLGFTSRFMPGAFVYHKRRVSWRSFYGQVRKFGLVRPILNSWHPASAKVTYWFPSFFMLGVFIAFLLLLIRITFPFLLLVAYLLILGIDASVREKSLKIGAMAIFATCVQFAGYGLAFLESMVEVCAGSVSFRESATQNCFSKKATDIFIALNVFLTTYFSGWGDPFFCWFLRVQRGF